MTTSDNNEAAKSKDVQPSSIAHGVLETFLSKLAATPGYEQIAARLRKAVIEDGKSTETSIRAALFADDAP